MISICPIIRDTQEELDILSQERRTNDTEYFTYAGFYRFIEQLQSEGIYYILIHPWSDEEEARILKIVKALTLK
jgi:hypothetical protein